MISVCSDVYFEVVNFFLFDKIIQLNQYFLTEENDGTEQINVSNNCCRIFSHENKYCLFVCNDCFIGSMEIFSQIFF